MKFNSIVYLTSRSNFLQVSPDVPITKQRNPEKFDPPDVLEGNRRELVSDLVVKAKQIEFLINSLPVPEPEEVQAKRLQALEEDMNAANVEYVQAVNRAKNLHQQIADTLRIMLSEDDVPIIEDLPG